MRPVSKRPVSLIALAMVTALTLLEAAGLAAEPAWYARKDNWRASLLASREALEARGLAPGGAFVSEIVRGGEPAQRIAAPIAGVRELSLYVVGAPEVVYGAATWADAQLVAADGARARLCEQKSLTLVEGQMSLDSNLKSGVSGPLSIAGRRFAHGVHVYPNGVSKVTVKLDREYERLEGWIGIDDWVGKNGAVRFIVAGPQAAARMDLWALLERDFADGPSRREMKWEQQLDLLGTDTQTDRAGYYRAKGMEESLARAKALNFEPLRLAIADLSQAFGERYPNGDAYARRLEAIEKALPAAVARAEAQDAKGIQAVQGLLADFDALQREAMLANPLLDFQKLLLIERKPNGDPRMPMGTGYGVGEYIGLPRQTSKHDPDIERYFGWENRIAVLSPVRPEGTLTTLYKPQKPALINDLDLHFDGDRVAFSMPGSHDKWHIFETAIADGATRQVTPGDQPDVHYYDPCYLPSGRIAFLSTACLQGVPCNAGVIVGMMYTMNAAGSDIRQICFEQDHDYGPVVTHDGRILYMRWDYTDTPHVWNRMLFTCNPDGTGQAEYYGANSYWPNAIFYARPVPGHPTKVVGIVTGHHVGRVGELTIFDPSQGRFEADGVVQQIPGRGKKVIPKIEDKLTEHSWPKFLHPYPLSEKYYLAACKPTPDSLWGIYLVDVFDNMTLIKEAEGQALLEPIPLRPTPTPPVIPDRTKPDAKDALVYLMDVYAGPGMTGVPRGTVKKLRLFSYHFAYQRIAGIDHRVGADGPWEAKRVLGTVDVEADGSAMFRVPAKTPFTLQPLDAEGQAVQLMRTWMTAMPGETVSCVGCHDNRGGSPPSKATIAQSKRPQAIRPWYGPTRGFAFAREVQPVLDRYCVGCHDGQEGESKALPDLRREQGYYVCYKGGNPQAEIVRDTPKSELLGKYGGIFEPSYIALRRHVRVGGLESDLHMLPPMEFHAGTSELIQMLRKGHHNVKLDAEAWDRLYTWIDLNAPCHGTWSELTPIRNNQRDRRLELQRLYGGLVEDLEITPPPPPAVAAVMPEREAAETAPLPKVEGWPFDAAEAQRRQKALGAIERTVDLGNGVSLRLVRIPAGRFVMGDAGGAADERPPSVVAIDRPFWMGQLEVTNEQFAQFDPVHDSRFEHRSSWIFSEEYLGWPLNRPKQPVVRVSWEQATAFCAWMSKRSGMRITLPTEAQWEYACRAGSDSPLWFGDRDTDFAPFANLADRSIRNLAHEGWRPKSPDLAAREARFDDGHLVTADAGSFKPNAWGLLDMHGNAAEWTRSALRPYPYREDDGRNSSDAQGARAVRGGSWFDRPARAGSAFRLGYQPYQRVFNVGFRVVCEE